MQNLLYFLQTYNDYGWLDDETSPLGGFAWRGGAERETTGILMWSEPFIVHTTDGEDVSYNSLRT